MCDRLDVKVCRMNLFYPFSVTFNFCIFKTSFKSLHTRVELLPGFKFTGKMVKKIKFTGKIGKNGKNGKNGKKW